MKYVRVRFLKDDGNHKAGTIQLIDEVTAARKVRTKAGELIIKKVAKKVATPKVVVSKTKTKK